MKILLSEPLPLRTTQMLGNFAEVTPLPLRYGDLSAAPFRLIRLDATTFFAADHPMVITASFIDKQTTESWGQDTRSDGAGNTWTVVVFAAPVPPEAEVSATGYGKRNPATGELLENPADIIEDILRISGRSESWDQLRGESAAAGLRLAGSVTEALSIRATIDAIASSAGAIWAPGMARLYPVAEVSGHVAALDKMKVTGIEVTAELTDTADVLRLFYDLDATTDKPQHYIEFGASPRLYGGVEIEIRLDWLRKPWNAEAVGRRLLGWLAGERYAVTFDCGDPAIRPGQWTRLVNHPEWPIEGADPEVMILSTEVTPGSKSVRCEGIAVLSSPTIEIIGHSVALPTTRDAGVEVGVKDGVATLVIRDENDAPVAGARVNLDGGQAKTTDANGKVSFEATPGPHKVAIQAPGKRAELLTMTL